MPTTYDNDRGIQINKIHKLEHQINRVESILLVSTGALITGMAYVIFHLIIQP